jgi:hypothetical protein
MSKKVKTFDDFKPVHVKSHIIPAKIKAGIEALTPAGWEYEAEFYKANAIGNMDGAVYRGGFEDFIITVNSGKKRIYCGSKALAAKMRAAI